MKIKIISVGKTKAKYWQLAEVDFTKRIQRYADLQLIYVKDASLESTKNVKVVKKIEAQRILDKITPEEFVIALDRCGTQMESRMFAQFLHNKMLQRINEFTFVVGGPLGLTQDFLQEADLI
ncbi:MAG: 23S rRNA (pseudouridine(1915)-N(3))-methyltransferase RlmH, partial [bacterium]